MLEIHLCIRKNNNERKPGGKYNRVSSNKRQKLWTRMNVIA